LEGNFKKVKSLIASVVMQGKALLSGNSCVGIKGLIKTRKIEERKEKEASSR